MHKLRGKLRTLSTHNLVNTIARAVATLRQQSSRPLQGYFVRSIAWPDALRTGAYRLKINIILHGEGLATQDFCTVAKS